NPLLTEPVYSHGKRAGGTVGSDRGTNVVSCCEQDASISHSLTGSFNLLTNPQQTLKGLNFTFRRKFEATVSDVASLAGVSGGTVSNFLNRSSYLTQETRESVQRAIDELGFEPSERARQFRRGRERTLGL